MTQTIRNLIKKAVIEKRNANWLSDLPSVIKKCNDTIHKSTKKIPIHTIKKPNEKIVFDNLHDKRKKLNSKFKISQLVRTADIKRVVSKGDSTIFSNRIYTITDVIHEFIPSYKINYLPGRHIEILLGPTKLTLEENNQIMKE